MMRILKGFTAALALAIPGPAAAATLQPAQAVQASPALGQLRHIVGTWDVRTEFLNPDASVARAAEGTYEFEWVIPDRVARGVSRIPSLDQASAILFYLRPAQRQIEMVSVGADGRLWVMTGPDDSEVRTTADVPTADGGRMRLRFTRFNVTPGRFESRMDWSTDGGASWTQGNRQVFVRRRG
jgi:hypothetical protein